MEQERIAREKEESAKKLKEQKIKETFQDTNSQWESDKKSIREQQRKQRLKNQGSQLKVKQWPDKDFSKKISI